MLHHRVISLLLCSHLLHAPWVKSRSETRDDQPNRILRRSGRRTPQLRLTPAQALPAVSDSAWNAGTAHSRAASQAAVARRGEAAAPQQPIDRDGPPLVPTQSVKGLPPALGGRRHGAFHGPQLSITDVSSRVNAGSTEVGGLTPELSSSTYPPAAPEPVQQQQQHLLAGRHAAPYSRKNSDDARWEVPPSGTQKHSSRIKSGVTAIACLIAGWFLVGRMYVHGLGCGRVGVRKLLISLLSSVMRGGAFLTSDVTLCISPDDCSST
jgi:hypothetical protein